MIDGEVGSGVCRVLMFSTFKGMVGEECIFGELCGAICMGRSELLMPLVPSSSLRPKCGITSFGRIESPVMISVEAKYTKECQLLAQD